MHTFLDNFHQDRKYSAQTSSHQEELKREEKYLSVSYLQNDYLNLDSKSGFGRDSERAHTVNTRCTFCGDVNQSAEKCFKRIRQEKEKYRTAGHSYNR